MEYPSDDKIVKMCQKNSREGYELLFDRYRRYIYTICWRSTRNEQDALDLSQDILMRIVKHIGAFDARKPLTPWIRRIAVNVCINFARGPTREILVDYSDPDSGVPDVADSDPMGMPEKKQMMAEDKKMIGEALSKLPGNERTALVLRHMEDRSYAEISSIMQVPEGTVKTWIFRGRRLLKAQLEQMNVWGV